MIIVRKDLKKADGFTLIELLVTVAIVGILASLAFASFTEYKAAARDANRVTMSHHVFTGIEAYFTDNLEYPPNPIPSRACRTAPEAGSSGNYDEECLQGIHQFLSEEHISQLFGVSQSARENYLQYYNYGDISMGAVVKIQLEIMGRKNPCSFTRGSWCNENLSGMRGAFCLCSGDASDYPT